MLCKKSISNFVGKPKKCKIDDKTKNDKVTTHKKVEKS